MATFRASDKVSHKRFGTGTVVYYEKMFTLVTWDEDCLGFYSHIHLGINFTRCYGVHPSELMLDEKGKGWDIRQPLYNKIKYLQEKRSHV